MCAVLLHASDRPVSQAVLLAGVTPRSMGGFQLDFKCLPLTKNLPSDAGLAFLRPCLCWRNWYLGIRLWFESPCQQQHWCQCEHWCGQAWGVWRQGSSQSSLYTQVLITQPRLCSRASPGTLHWGAAQTPGGEPQQRIPDGVLLVGACQAFQMYHKAYLVLEALGAGGNSGGKYFVDAAGCWLPFPVGRKDTIGLYILNFFRAPKILHGHINLDALNQSKHQ